MGERDRWRNGVLSRINGSAFFDQPNTRSHLSTANRPGRLLQKEWHLPSSQSPLSINAFEGEKINAKPYSNTTSTPDTSLTDKDILAANQNVKTPAPKDISPNRNSDFANSSRFMTDKVPERFWDVKINYNLYDSNIYNQSAEARQNPVRSAGFRMRNAEFGVRSVRGLEKEFEKAVKPPRQSSPLDWRRKGRRSELRLSASNETVIEKNLDVVLSRQGRYWGEVSVVSQTVSFLFLFPGLYLPTYIPFFQFKFFGVGSDGAALGHTLNDRDELRFSDFEREIDQHSVSTVPGESADSPVTLVLVRVGDRVPELTERDLKAMALPPRSRILVLEAEDVKPIAMNWFSKIKLPNGVRPERIRSGSELPTLELLQGIFARNRGHIPIVVFPSGFETLLANYERASRQNGFVVSLPRRAEARLAFSYLLGRYTPAALLKKLPSEDLVAIQWNPNRGGLTPAFVPFHSEVRFVRWFLAEIAERMFEAAA